MDNILKAFHKGEEIALHPLIKNAKGEHITNKDHYPPNKNITGEDTKSSYREKMSQIGKNALEFFNLYMQQNSKSKYNYRGIAGILSLRKKYDDRTIDNACLRAKTYGAIRYKTVKQICDKGITNLPDTIGQTYINENVTPIARPLSEYSRLLN